MMSEEILRLERVSKNYDDRTIFSDISFTLKKGSSLCIKAPSGKGKSTLLSIAGLLLQPSEGRIYFDGQDVSTLSDEERSAIRNKRIGFLFQHTQLAGTLRAGENVSLAANFIKDKSMKSADVEKRRKELMKKFGLEDRYFYFPHQLSIGQKRRVACGRALFMNPDLIIADEPTNDLDEENKMILVDALFERVKTGECAMLFATHDSYMAELADDIIEL